MLAILMVAVSLPEGTAQAQRADGEEETDAAGGSADLILRFSSQVTFTVWGNGTTANEFSVEAAPGDGLQADVLVKVLGGRNSLERAENFTASLFLQAPNSTVPLATTIGVVAPNETVGIPVRLNATVPAWLPVGEHGLVFRLETGTWDPNHDNNAPRIPAETVLRIGRPTLVEAPYELTPRFLIGPVVFAGLLAVPFVARRARHTQVAISLRERSVTWWEDVTCRWTHREASARARTGLWLAAAGFFVAGLVVVVAGGGVAFGLSGVLDAALLGVLAAAVHLVGGTLARLRGVEQRLRNEGKDPGTEAIAWVPLAKDAAIASLQTLLVVATAALFWQQLASLTALFRWPVLASLGSFAVIGISIGAIYALIALGYTMVYGILKFINFAHGEIFMWGAYFAWIFVTAYPVVPLPVALLISIVLTGALGALTERVAYRPLRGASRLTPLVTAIALSLLLQALSQFFFKAQKVTYTAQGSTFAGSGLQAWLDGELSLLGAIVDHLAVVVLVASIVLMLALHLFVRYSRMGRAMRAVADDLDTARTIGIDVNRVIMTTFVVGSMLAAVGGVAYGIKFGLNPTMGLFVGIKAFTAAVVGGIGNIYGAFLGGFVIGLAENVGGQFIQPEFQKVITFGILILFLLFRPQGIFGGGEGADRK